MVTGFFFFKKPGAWPGSLRHQSWKVRSPCVSRAETEQAQAEQRERAGFGYPQRVARSEQKQLLTFPQVRLEWGLANRRQRSGEAR